jgi:hypothetical protein
MDILASCKDSTGWAAGGQEFDDNDYNVVVRQNNCSLQYTDPSNQ